MTKTLMARTPEEFSKGAFWETRVYDDIHIIDFQSIGKKGLSQQRGFPHPLAKSHH